MWGRVFVNVVSLTYIGMIYINVGEICFIPMNYTMNCSMVFVSSDGTPFACSFNIFYIYQAFILLFHIAPSSLPFLSLSVHMSLFLSLSLTLPISPSLSLFLWYLIPFSLLVVFPCGLEMSMFSSCNPKFFAVRHIHYSVNPSNDHFHTDAVVPSSDHCRTEIVLPPSDHYCIENSDSSAIG